MPRPLEQLYKDILMDHARRPRNAGRLERADMRAHAVNPLCGDELMVDVALDGERIREVRFRVRGCAISTASASMLSEQLKGLTLSEVSELERCFQQVLADAEATLPEALEPLEPLLSVRDYPHRQSCARLAWDALRALETV
ncbi:MAG TPA: SUF system NifU family Fe-S cluster assembly protein [Pyrinomonadaceae bacterium]|nr:SUF system NifU family Fe-S cluster assembly protein [Pyrinomonadaceae bacterium]